MSKLGLVCSILMTVAALTACGDDDGGGAGAAGVGGGGTLCEVQLNRARNECAVPEQYLGLLSAGGTNDAGMPVCEGQSLCVATCAQNAPCADLTNLTSPFFTCALGCNQQQQP